MTTGSLREAPERRPAWPVLRHQQSHARDRRRGGEDHTDVHRQGTVLDEAGHACRDETETSQRGEVHLGSLRYATAPCQKDLKPSVDDDQQGAADQGQRRQREGNVEAVPQREMHR